MSRATARMGVGATGAQLDLERLVAQEIASSRIPMSGPGFKIVPAPNSAWENPPGWTGRWMLVREGGDPVVSAFAPPLYVAVEGYDAEGRRVSRRAAPPLHLQRPRYAPKLVFVDDHKDYEKKRQREGWTDADEMPAHLRQLLLECYGGDPRCAAKGCHECRTDAGLTRYMRQLLAPEIAERDAARRKPAPAPAAPAKKATTKRRTR